jgi:type II secretory pathway pseudopilin PulG
VHSANNRVGSGQVLSKDAGQCRRWNGSVLRFSQGDRGGFSLLDVTLSLALVAIGMGAMLYSMIEAKSLARYAQERSAAFAAAQSALESMQSETFSEVFARFNSIPGDDPAGGVSPGDDFVVRGLTALPTDQDGMPGGIEFPGNGAQLLENVADPDLGMPRDLNGDLQPPDGLDHAGDYIVLPVRIRVRWNGVRGSSNLTLITTLNNERKTP